MIYFFALITTLLFAIIINCCISFSESFRISFSEDFPASRLGLLKSKRLRLLQNQNFVNSAASIDEVISVTSSLQQYEAPEVGVEIYAGSAIAVIPIIWASFEFWSRIQTQQQCLVCNGSGLVKVTRSGNPLSRMRKCWSCGGFLPWLGWKMFFFSSFVDPGNGGVLQRPAKDYDATNAAIRQGQQIIGKESENQSPNEGDNMTSPVIGKEDKNGQI